MSSQCNKNNNMVCISNNMCQSSSNECCFCIDKRPEVIKMVNQFYIDGRGIVKTINTMNISRYYCPGCKQDTVSNAEIYNNISIELDEAHNEKLEDFRKNHLIKTRIKNIKYEIEKIKKLMKDNIDTGKYLEYKKKYDILNAKLKNIL